MLIKVNDRYLEFNDDIEIERRAKLFEDVAGLDGDFSYQFKIPFTEINRSILGYYSPNSSDRPWSKKIPASIQNESGLDIYTGYLTVEDKDASGWNASFFSGNNNWFSELNQDIRTFNFDKLVRLQTSSEIESSWTRDSGVVWPLVDRGGIYGRNSVAFYDGDFQPFIYVKDVINSVLSEKGIKIEGDLLTDSLYNQLITSSNSLGAVKDEINRNTAYIGKSSAQLISSTSPTAIEFQNESEPYSDESNLYNTTLFKYVSQDDYKIFNIDLSIKISSTAASAVILTAVINGATTVWTGGTVIENGTFNTTISLKNLISNGTEIQIMAERIALFPNYFILAGSYVKFYPVKFFKVFPKQILPNKSASEFLADIFRIFNVVTNYDQTTKTLSAYKFNTILSRNSIDISDYVSEVVSENYEEFVSDYSKNNLLKWEQQDVADSFNQQNREYGSGVIVVDNDNLDDESDLVEMDYVAPFHRTDYHLGISFPFLDFVSMEETTETRDITSVTDNGDGYARFNWSSGGAIGLNLIRISDSTNEIYNGDYRVIVNTANYCVLEGVFYDTNATARIAVLDWKEEDNDDQILLVNVPNVSISDITTYDNIIGPSGSTKTSFAFAYFYQPFLNTQFTNTVKDSLCFDPIEPTKQVSLIQKYWTLSSNVLNSATKDKVIAYLPEAVFRKIDFIRPLYVRTDSINGYYYPNNIFGYKDQNRPCEIELLKLG